MGDGFTGVLVGVSVGVLVGVLVGAIVGLLWNPLQPLVSLGERVGGRVGTGKGPASQCARICQNYPLANYTFRRIIVRGGCRGGRGPVRNRFQTQRRSALIPIQDV